MFFLWHTEQAKELYSCKESCTWCWALEQLQCVTCTQEQLPLKPWSKLFVDIRSFRRTLQGNTTRGNALIRPGRLSAPPFSNSCSIFHSFPSMLRMRARGEGIRVRDLELSNKGATPGSWHHLSLISTASWDRPCHCCVQGYPRLSFLSPCSLLAVTPPWQWHFPSSSAL